MEEKSSQPHMDIKDSVLMRIEQEGLAPLPRFYWLFQDYFIWALWGLSVVFGALSVAVMYFVAMHANYAFYAILNDNFLTFAVEYLPYIWAMVFALMVLLSYINLSYTKHGYRYPIKHIVFSSLVFSVVGGSVLHFLGAGFYVDRELGKLSKHYDSQGELEMRMWQNAKEGRLVGTIEEGQTGHATIIKFRDAKQVLWMMDTADLDRRDIGQLMLREPVKVIGIVGTSSNFMIHACGVFPWMLKKAPWQRELRESRLEFAEMLERHRLPAPPQETLTQENLVMGEIEGMCRGLQVTKSERQ